MAGEIFYQPPAPQQPIPHAPIPKQGDQPPITDPSRITEEIFFTIIGQWPTGMEPGLSQPYQPWRTAAITSQPKVSQPPISDPTRIVAETFFAILSQWPTGLEPGLPQLGIRTAAITSQPRVDQPPINDPTKLVEETFLAILGQWPTGMEPGLPQLGTRTAAITSQPKVDQPPPFNGVISDLMLVVQSWTPPDPQPQRDLKKIVPLTLVYGDVPPKYSTVNANTILSAWTPPDPPPYQPPRTAGITIQSAVSQPPIPTRANINAILSSWIPPLPQPWQRPLTIAPLTLKYGSQPPPFSIAEIMQVTLASFPTGLEYAAPQQRPSAATIPLPVVVSFVPFTLQPASILASWQALDPLPQKNINIAPLTLKYGSQPPPFSIVNRMLVVQSWPTGLEPGYPQQLGTRTAAITSQPKVDQPPLLRQSLTAQLWPVDAPTRQQSVFTPIVPVIVTIVPVVAYPMATILSWYSDPAPQQRQRLIAPQTLKYGDAPPHPSPVNARLIVGTWEPPAPTVQVIHTQIVSVDAPPIRRPDVIAIRSWQVETAPQQRPARFPFIVAPPIPMVPYPIGTVLSWQVDPWPQQRRIPIAPMTLAYGDQPPRRSYVNATTILAAWTPPDPMPRQAPASVIPFVFVPFIHGDLFLTWTVPIIALEWNVEPINLTWEIDPTDLEWGPWR